VERAVARAQVGEQLKMKRGKNGTRGHHRLLKSWPSSSFFLNTGDSLFFGRERRLKIISPIIFVDLRGNQQRRIVNETRKRNDHRLQSRGTSISSSFDLLISCCRASRPVCLTSKLSAASNRAATGKASRISLVIGGLIPVQENPAKHRTTQRSSH
jgi:hypothetical protein